MPEFKVGDKVWFNDNEDNRRTWSELVPPFTIISYDSFESWYKIADAKGRIENLFAWRLQEIEEKEEEEVSVLPQRDIRVVAVDMDGTLTSSEAWNVEDVANAVPRQDVIDKTNELARTKFVVIWTARRDHLIEATIAWLKKHNVHYHAISNYKMPADLYVDDKGILPEVFVARGVN